MPDSEINQDGDLLACIRFFLLCRHDYRWLLNHRRAELFFHRNRQRYPTAGDHVSG